MILQSHGGAPSGALTTGSVTARQQPAPLEHLWPRHLKLTEYVDLLPARRSLSYRLRLDPGMNLVAAEHLDDALDWSVKTLRQHHPKALVAVTLLAQCIRLLSRHETSRPDPREAQAGQALAALAADPELSHPVEARSVFTYLRESLEPASALRRRLAGHVLRHSSQDHVLELMSTTDDVGLFPGEDLLYWAERWPDLPQKARLAAQPLFSRRPRPEDELLKESVEKAQQADEELRAATAWWDLPPSKWELRRQQQEQEQRRRNTFDEGVVTLLSAWVSDVLSERGGGRVSGRCSGFGGQARDAGDLVPDREAEGHFGSVAGGCHQMAAGPEVR
ncbi:hypothetical protein SAMN02787118_110129 [Streptomyces mirabilis]|uniref:Uncharacterized protein n=1 Tax=Streptomyces mirabilis TaxID=68239 RepID=A0A1I2KI58_9ACTN|nr:hypothetical protein SAMN02787118_110129 [Streptomyces mirabilis]